jgi:hypothetical protein
MPHTADPFAHRVNPDKTIDSICKSCFMTVGTAEEPGALRKREGEHECQGRRLEVVRAALTPDSPFKRRP